MANAIFAVRPRPEDAVSPEKQGRSLSSSIRNSTPPAKPPAAGTQPRLPNFSDSFIAGISRLHTEAAIITPAANPRKARLALSEKSSLFIKSTIPAPSAVIRKVNPVAQAAHIKPVIVCFLSFDLCYTMQNVCWMTQQRYPVNTQFSAI
jgi:hypothetical protein